MCGYFCKFLLISVSALIIIGSFGCEPSVSLHGLSGPDGNEISFDKRLIGVWEKESDPNTKIVFVRKEDDKGSEEYQLIYVDADDRKGFFNASLIDLRTCQFLDVTAARHDCNEADSKWLYNRFLSIETHLFLKYERNLDELRLDMFDNDYLRESLKKDPWQLKHEILGERVILTDSAGVMQKFLLNHFQHKELFESLGPFEKVKSADPNKIFQQLQQ